jgi:enoyl-CoA hydratase
MSQPHQIIQFFPWGMRKAMEMMLTGDSLTGVEAADAGFANTAFRPEDLEDEVLAMAERVAKIPPDLQAFNNRSVHRQMEMMGISQAVRATTDLQQLAFFTQSARETFKTMAEGPLTKALDKRDKKFEDYRTTDKSGE